MGVDVVADDRVRLVMMILAGSTWPDREQRMEPHAVHPHSKQVSRYAGQFREHAAVTGLNALLERGVSLKELFATALNCSGHDFAINDALPEIVTEAKWLDTLPAFQRDALAKTFWSEHAAPWSQAVSDLAAIFDSSRLFPFLIQFPERAVVRRIAVMPSIVYPQLTPVVVKLMSELWLILPPSKAWGESPPWPFAEDPPWVISQACWYLSPHFYGEEFCQLDEMKRRLLKHATVTLCLEQDFGVEESLSYLVRNRKEQDLPNLPESVEQLRQHLAGTGSRSLSQWVA